MRALHIAAALLLLVPNTVTDIRKKEVLPLLAVPLGVAGVLVSLLAERQPPAVVLAALVPGVLFLGLSKASRGGVGLGDGIVVAALGAWLPLWDCLLVVILSLAGVAAVALAMSAARRAKARIPYVPFLLAAYGVSFLLVR